MQTAEWMIAKKNPKRSWLGTGQFVIPEKKQKKKFSTKQRDRQLIRLREEHLGVN